MEMVQHGPEQRLTDPQAARISSFWYAADPERKNKTFRRGIGQDTLETYLSHCTQMLTFLWNGWQGKLFPNSLAALAGKATRSEQSTRQTCVGSDQLANSGDHRTTMKMVATTVTRRQRTIVMATATKRAVRIAESRESVLTRRKTSQVGTFTTRSGKCSACNDLPTFLLRWAETTEIARIESRPVFNQFFYN